MIHPNPRWDSFCIIPTSLRAKFRILLYRSKMVYWKVKQLFGIVANLHCTFFPIVVEVHSILAELQLVFFYPLGMITSPLCGCTCNFGVFATQINLVPLICIVVAS